MCNENEQKLMKLKNQLIKIGVIVAFTLAVLLAIFWAGKASAKEKYETEITKLEQELADQIACWTHATTEVDISVVNASIQEIGELATIEYLYTDAGKFEDTAELFGKELNWSLTTKSFITKWDGTIKAGIDISEVVAEKDAETKEIIVYLPEAKILSHEIDEESIETLDQKNGLFNSVEVQDIRKFDAVCKEAMEEKVIENGLLEKALENAKEIIYRLIYTDIVKEQGYTIRFELTE